MTKGEQQKWKEKLNRSSYFFIALFLHVVILAMVATIVIFQPTILTTPDFQKTYVPPAAASSPPPAGQVSVKTPTVPIPAVTPTIVNNVTVPTFTVPIPAVNAPIDPNVHSETTSGSPGDGGLGGGLRGIGKTVNGWRPKGNIPMAAGDVRNVVAKFPVFLAQYAGGDWNCNNYMDPAGHITSGSLPNLVFQIGVWSHGSLKADNVKSIRVDSPLLLTDPPPFIFFTGHRDFVLTQAEIENLRKYLQVGGCVWGDSAFAGDGSRFDVAFHREMKRVLPDDDKKFEALPSNHDILSHSWFPIDKTPTGMNYRADPVQVINIAGKVAVIYTPNDYSDMMTMLLKTDVDPPVIDMGGDPPTPEHPLYTPNKFVHNAPYYFRNYTPESAQDSYKLSMNILAYLLIRFDSELEMAP